MKESPDLESTLKSGRPEDLKELFHEVHPADLAEGLEDLDDDRWDEVVAEVPAPVFGKLVEHIPAIDAIEHLGNSPPEYRRQALAHVADDELVDLLQELPAEEVEEYVELLPKPAQERSRRLLAFPETSAGGRMTTEIATVELDMTVGEAIDSLRAVKETSELLARIFVVDKDGRLMGKMRLRDLAFSGRDERVADIMDDDLMAIDAYADQEEAARLIARYDLMALPVVNPNRELLGVITHDDAVEILEEETSEDFEKLSGIGVSDPDEGYLRTSVLAHFRRRFGWVITMAYLGIASGFVLYHFEEVLGALPLLAIYLTTVVASGGNTGSQASTMVIRAMSLEEFGIHNFGEVLWKEVRVGFLLGSLVGLGIFLHTPLFAWLGIGGSERLIQVGLVVGLALAVQITCSTLLGASLPLLAKTLQLDPAVVAAPIITTAVDVTGLAIYFILAKLLIGL